MIREILQIGHETLGTVCETVTGQDAEMLDEWITDLHDTLMDFRDTYGAGRAISLPQIGVTKRMIYAVLDKPYVFINPRLTFPDDETYLVRDDCMSWPGHVVEVMRHRRAIMTYEDAHFCRKCVFLEGDYAELLQHECDHLEGITIDRRAAYENAVHKEQMKRHLEASDFAPLKVIDIRQAREDDLAGVKALLKANHVDNLTEEQKADGFVTTNMTDEQMKTLSGIEGGITIAADGEKVVAFALAAPWDFWEQWPFFVNMIGELPKYEYAGQRLSKENTYQYGPVCVDRAYRGQGIFENVFDLSLQGMDVIGDFGYNGNTYYLLACETTAGCIHTR